MFVKNIKKSSTLVNIVLRWLIAGKMNLQMAFQINVDFIKQNTKAEESYGGMFECGEERGMLERCREGWSERKRERADQCCC